jgi:hypothetical protein
MFSSTIEPFFYQAKHPAMSALPLPIQRPPAKVLSQAAARFLAESDSDSDDDDAAYDIINRIDDAQTSFATKHQVTLTQDEAFYYYLTNLGKKDIPVDKQIKIVRKALRDTTKPLSPVYSRRAVTFIAFADKHVGNDGNIILNKAWKKRIKGVEKETTDRHNLRTARMDATNHYKHKQYRTGVITVFNAASTRAQEPDTFTDDKFDPVDRTDPQWSYHGIKTILVYTDAPDVGFDMRAVINVSVQFVLNLRSLKDTSGWLGFDQPDLRADVDSVTEALIGRLKQPFTPRDWFIECALFVIYPQNGRHKHTEDMDSTRHQLRDIYQEVLLLEGGAKDELVIKMTMLWFAYKSHASDLLLTPETPKDVKIRYSENTKKHAFIIKDQSARWIQKFQGTGTEFENAYYETDWRDCYKSKRMFTSNVKNQTLSYISMQFVLSRIREALFDCLDKRHNEDPLKGKGYQAFENALYAYNRLITILAGPWRIKYNNSVTPVPLTARTEKIWKDYRAQFERLTLARDEKIKAIKQRCKELNDEIKVSDGDTEKKQKELEDNVECLKEIEKDQKPGLRCFVQTLKGTFGGASMNVCDDRYYLRVNYSKYQGADKKSDAEHVEKMRTDVEKMRTDKSEVYPTPGCMMPPEVAIQLVLNQIYNPKSKASSSDYLFQYWNNWMMVKAKITYLLLDFERLGLIDGHYGAFKTLKAVAAIMQMQYIANQPLPIAIKGKKYNKDINVKEETEEDIAVPSEIIPRCYEWLNDRNGFGPIDLITVPKKSISFMYREGDADEDEEVIDDDRYSVRKIIDEIIATKSGFKKTYNVELPTDAVLYIFFKARGAATSKARVAALELQLENMEEDAKKVVRKSILGDKKHAMVELAKAAIAFYATYKEPDTGEWKENDKRVEQFETYIDNIKPAIGNPLVLEQFRILVRDVNRFIDKYGQTDVRRFVKSYLSFVRDLHFNHQKLIVDALLAPDAHEAFTRQFGSPSVLETSGLLDIETYYPDGVYDAEIRPTNMDFTEFMHDYIWFQRLDAYVARKDDGFRPSDIRVYTKPAVKSKLEAYINSIPSPLTTSSSSKSSSSKRNKKGGKKKRNNEVLTPGSSVESYMTWFTLHEETLTALTKHFINDDAKERFSLMFWGVLLDSYDRTENGNRIRKRFADLSHDKGVPVVTQLVDAETGQFEEDEVKDEYWFELFRQSQGTATTPLYDTLKALVISAGIIRDISGELSHAMGRDIASKLDEDQQRVLFAFYRDYYGKENNPLLDLFKLETLTVPGLKVVLEAINLEYRHKSLLHKAQKADENEVEYDGIRGDKKAFNDNPFGIINGRTIVSDIMEQKTSFEKKYTVALSTDDALYLYFEAIGPKSSKAGVAILKAQMSDIEHTRVEFAKAAIAFYAKYKNSRDGKWKVNKKGKRLTSQLETNIKTATSNKTEKEEDADSDSSEEEEDDGDHKVTTEEQDVKDGDEEEEEEGEDDDDVDVIESVEDESVNSGGDDDDDEEDREYEKQSEVDVAWVLFQTNAAACIDVDYKGVTHANLQIELAVYMISITSDENILKRMLEPFSVAFKNLSDLKAIKQTNVDYRNALSTPDLIHKMLDAYRSFADQEGLSEENKQLLGNQHPGLQMVRSYIEQVLQHVDSGIKTKEYNLVYATNEDFQWMVESADFIIQVWQSVQDEKSSTVSINANFAREIKSAESVLSEFVDYNYHDIESLLNCFDIDKDLFDLARLAIASPTIEDELGVAVEDELEQAMEMDIDSRNEHVETAEPWVAPVTTTNQGLIIEGDEDDDSDNDEDYKPASESDSDSETDEKIDDTELYDLNGLRDKHTEPELVAPEVDPNLDDDVSVVGSDDEDDDTDQDGDDDDGINSDEEADKASGYNKAPVTFVVPDAPIDTSNAASEYSDINDFVFLGKRARSSADKKKAKTYLEALMSQKPKRRDVDIEMHDAEETKAPTPSRRKRAAEESDDTSNQKKHRILGRPVLRVGNNAFKLQTITTTYVNEDTSDSDDDDGKSDDDDDGDDHLQESDEQKHDDDDGKEDEEKDDKEKAQLLIDKVLLDAADTNNLPGSISKHREDIKQLLDLDVILARLKTEDRDYTELKSSFAWLNSDAINDYLLLMRHSVQTTNIIASHDIERSIGNLFKHNESVQTPHLTKRLQRIWKRCFPTQLSHGGETTIWFPVNPGSHWYLAGLRKDAPNIVFVADPLYEPEGSYDIQTEHIRKFAREQSSVPAGYTPFWIEDAPFQCIEVQMQRQTDGHNCGVLMLMAASVLWFGNDSYDIGSQVDTESSDVYRKWIALCIVFPESVVIKHSKKRSLEQSSSFSDSKKIRIKGRVCVGGMTELTDDLTNHIGASVHGVETKRDAESESESESESDNESESSSDESV